MFLQTQEIKFEHTVSKTRKGAERCSQHNWESVSLEITLWRNTYVNLKMEIQSNFLFDNLGYYWEPVQGYYGSWSCQNIQHGGSNHAPHVRFNYFIMSNSPPPSELKEFKLRR